MPILQRALSPLVEVRKEETTGVLLMFAYSFLAMTAYNIIQPLTRSKLISSLGAVNVPWVIFGSGLFIGVLMLGYTRVVSALPRRWALPITQIAMAVAMVIFWFLFQRGGDWVSVGFYVWGLLLGVLLISQFWTLANSIYDPRQAKRLFGFVGGGVALGGMTGAGLTATLVQTLGTNRLILVSAAVLLISAGIVSIVLGRERHAAISVDAWAAEERGISIARALALLRESRQVQLIAVVICFGSLGAALIDQQLNMAAEVFKGKGQDDSIGAFLAQVRFGLSAAAFVIQVWITPRIHRYLGIGFALLMLPTNLGATAAIILLNAALWAPAVSSVLDRSLRYTVDKTTREVLFLPLPSALRQEVKPFVDVTVDRLSRGIGALLILVLIQPWGFALQWYQLSLVSLVLTVVWYFMAVRAKREYLVSFRRSLETRDVEPEQVRLNVADLSTIETLVQELAHPDPARVVYAIDVLESLDKRSLVTPLLLYHEAPAVRKRALRALAASGDTAARWAPQIRRAIGDPEPSVRSAALLALAAIGHDDAATQARPLLADPDPRIQTTAAIALAGSSKEGDVTAALMTLNSIISDTGRSSLSARRDAAASLGEIKDPRFRRLLIPLLQDPDAKVAEAALAGVRKSGAEDFLFVPALLALLRNRQLKGHARDTLASYGEPAIDMLAHFMRDPDEDVWLRRHIPTTVARVASQKSVDVLLPALQDPDGFLRYKAVAALERLRRADASLTFDRAAIEPQITREARAYFTALSLHYNLFVTGKLPSRSMLATALTEKMLRTKDRVFRLLSLIYPWADIAAAQWTLAHGESRNRASASEYLDTLLSGPLRKIVMPVIEDMPLDEKVRRGNVISRTRGRDVEETLLQLINDDDQVIAALAIDEVRQHRLWSLTGDIEHVLAHRDVRDWDVFEAASWALAEQRMPAERRRELWLEPLPAAVLADRLRAMPLFGSVTVDEIFRIASASKQVRHQSGAILIAEGSTPDMIYLLLDGSVIASGAGVEPIKIDAPAALGFTEALEGSVSPRSVRASGTAVTLVLTTDQLRTMLADNTELVRGLFAELSHHTDAPGSSAVQSTAGAGELARLARDGVITIEKIFALQFVPYFSRLSADEAQELAAIAHTTPMKAGATLFTQSARPAMWLLASGEVRLDEPGGTSVSARGGDVIGSLFSLADHEVGRTATVVRDGLALRIDRDDLFELLGERPDLLRQTFAGMMKLSKLSDLSRISGFSSLTGGRTAV
ncbi:MAG: Npt1/Npt2 family nucleotide transporter [Vicinamibacterales bacterium]